MGVITERRDITNRGYGTVTGDGRTSSGCRFQCYSRNSMLIYTRIQISYPPPFSPSFVSTSLAAIYGYEFASRVSSRRACLYEAIKTNKTVNEHVETSGGLGAYPMAWQNNSSLNVCPSVPSKPSCALIPRTIPRPIPRPIYIYI